MYYVNIYPDPNDKSADYASFGGTYHMQKGDCETAHAK